MCEPSSSQKQIQQSLELSFKKEKKFLNLAFILFHFQHSFFINFLIQSSQKYIINLSFQFSTHLEKYYGKRIFSGSKFSQFSIKELNWPIQITRIICSLSCKPKHQINGVNADLEVHFVHIASASQNSDCNNISNKLTVYGLLFNRQANASNYTVFETMQNKNSNVTSFDLSEFLNKLTDQTYYHYYGSLIIYQYILVLVGKLSVGTFLGKCFPLTTYNSISLQVNTQIQPCMEAIQQILDLTITTGKGLVGSVSVISEGESNGSIITILCILFLIL
ncbi:hypothetical protein pb186bvf_000181 [Paramecium bursaria]